MLPGALPNPSLAQLVEDYGNNPGMFYGNGQGCVHSSFLPIAHVYIPFMHVYVPLIHAYVLLILISTPLRVFEAGILTSPQSNTTRTPNVARSQRQEWEEWERRQREREQDAPARPDGAEVLLAARGAGDPAECERV